MAKGGYQIIDLQGVSLSGSSKTISGLHGALDNNQGKAVLISGLNIGGTIYDEFFTIATKSGTSYTIPVGDKQVITVTNSDGVTVAAPVKGYVHIINVKKTGVTSLRTTIINQSSAQINTFTKLLTALTAISNVSVLPCSGFFVASSVYYSAIALSRASDTTIGISYVKTDSTVIETFASTDGYEVTDMIYTF